MASGCGSWREVAEHMGLAEYTAMHRYWSDHPPVHLMVAAYLGIKPRTPADNDAAMEALCGMFGVMPGVTTPIE